MRQGVGGVYRCADSKVEINEWSRCMEVSYSDLAMLRAQWGLADGVRKQQQTAPDGQAFVSTRRLGRWT